MNSGFQEHTVDIPRYDYGYRKKQMFIKVIIVDQFHSSTEFYSMSACSSDKAVEVWLAFTIPLGSSFSTDLCPSLISYRWEE